MSLIIHMRPDRLPARALRFTHTFGLGGIALVLFGLLVFTGVLMMFVYDPSPERAWQSIDSFERHTLFGGLVRGVHFWSANLLLPVVLLHLARVFLTGGYQGNRKRNWHIGLGTGFFVILSGFTGYLLPWDQTAYWAITICTEMLGQVPGIGSALKSAVIGGSEIGSATTVNFYALHVAVTPFALVALLSWHFWLVRTTGGVVLPTARPSEAGKIVSFSPDLLIREAVVTAVVVALVLVLAAGLGAPLGDPANPGVSPNPAKAPWYFMGLQELLIHVDALFAVIVVPACVVAFLIAAPYLCREPEPAGDWFLTTKGRRLAIVAALSALVLVPLFVVVDELAIAPFALLAVVIAAFYFLVRRMFAPTQNEMVQTMFVLLFVSFVALTITGIWFRGAGMSLVWPWQI